MKINSRPKEKFKLPREARFKGEQRSLKIRSGTIAKFNQRAVYGYTSSKKQIDATRQHTKQKNELNAGLSSGTNHSENTESTVGTQQFKEDSSTFITQSDKKKANSLTKHVKGEVSSFDQGRDRESAFFYKSKKETIASKNKKQAKEAAKKAENLNEDKIVNKSKKTKETKSKPRIGNEQAAPSESIFSASAKKIGATQLLDQSFSILDQEEDTEGLQEFKTNAKNTDHLFKGAKKVDRFLTKNQKFSQSVTTGKLESLRFASDKQPSKVASVAMKSVKSKSTEQVTTSQVAIKIQQAVAHATSKVVSSFTASNPIGWIVAGIAFVLLIFFGLFFMFNSQSNASSNDGVFYVKHWDGDNAYNSSLLAQRYGITAEQIDTFIANEGYTVDSRATGEEFLRLQAISGIDVRMLVAFAQWESSYGTAGVALQFPKANIFGYGAFDNDPNQGASWDNTRAVQDFRSTQIDSYGNRTLAIMDARARAYHNNTLQPGEFVYWTKLDAGKSRAETAEKLDRWIDANGGTPDPPGGYGPVGGGGAGLAVLDQRLGTVISGEFGGLTGECYAVSAFYANSINPSIILRGGIKASDIGTDYPWASWGWSVIRNPSYQEIRAGDIINYATGGNMGSWYAHSLYGHTGVVGQVLGNNQYVLYDQNPGPLKTWTVTFYPGSVSSVVRPPN